MVGLYEPRKALAGLLVLLLVAAAVPAAPSGDDTDATGAEATGMTPMRYDAGRDLVARRTTTPVVIDGVADSLWDDALALKAFATGASDNLFIDFKAVFDDDNVYILAKWTETAIIGISPNYDREPWELTSNATPGSWDHKGWGEDRLSFMWESPFLYVENFGTQGCDGVCHLQLEMFTLNPGEFLDTWVWSAATTNVNGYADDGFLTNNNSVTFDPTRMHVTKSDIDWDPGNDGWLVNNDTTAGGGPYRPAYIWKDGVTPTNRSFLLESEARQVDWGTFDIGTLPAGYFVPGTLIKAPSGDRADVSAKGNFDGSSWTVEFKRARSTGHAKDVEFLATNVAYNFSIAVTNNMTGENHSKAPNVYKMWLAEPEQPDLTPWNIALVNEPYTINSNVAVNVFVENIGWADAGASSLALYWDDQATPVGYHDFPALAWGQTNTAYDVTWDSTGLTPGLHTIKVVADANGTVSEIDEDNNVFTKEVELFAELKPDLTVTDVSISPAEVPKDSLATVTVTVRNVGTLAVTGAVLDLTIEATGAPIGTDTIDLPVGGSEDVDFPWVVTLPEGDHVINATIDPEDVVAESDEGNNTVWLDVAVLAPSGPDLVIDSLVPFNRSVHQGEETLATVTVRNAGPAEAPAGLEVALYLDEAFTQGTVGQVGRLQSLEAIPPQGTWVAGIAWTVPVDAEIGPHFLRAHVNWDRGVTELDYSNDNATFEDLTVLPRPMPDLVVASVDPVDTTVKLGAVVNFTIVVGNEGGADAQPTTLRIVDVTHNTTLDVRSVPMVNVSSTEALHFEWLVFGVQPGPLSLSFLIDPDDHIAEENELNNVLTTTLTVQPADVSDLAVLSVTFTPAEPRVGNSVTISVLVSNNGTKGSVDATLEVRLGNNRIGEKPIGALAAGAQTTVEVVWPATEITEPIRYTLRIELDPDNVNKETMLDNNVMEQVPLTFLKAPAPVLGNLSVTSSADKVKDGNEVTVTVRLENAGDAAATVRIVLKDGAVEAGSRQAVIVPAGGSKEETFVVKLTGTGDHALTATVYKGTDVAKDASGKDMVETATVKVEKKDDGPGFGAVAAVAAVALAVALVALAAGRRRD